jgi:hypothetical protein
MNWMKVDFDGLPCERSVCWCGGCAEDPCVPADHEAKAYGYGLAAAFGIIGMFTAIRDRYLEHVHTWCPRCVGLALEHHPECNWST